MKNEKQTSKTYTAFAAGIGVALGVAAGYKLLSDKAKNNKEAVAEKVKKNCEKAAQSLEDRIYKLHSA